MQPFFSSLGSPSNYRDALPASKQVQGFIQSSRQNIRNILNGSDDRLLVITGPCSIHHSMEALEYAQYLANLQPLIQDQVQLVMRAYCEKPRTGYGWKGFLYDPDLNGECDIEKGLYETRKLFLSINALGIPIATEFLDPMTYPFFDDLVAWGAVGARTSTSQIHRQMASGFDMPIGFKNDIHGDVRSAINGILSASKKHSFLVHDLDGKLKVSHTQGNPDAHLVLRGGFAGPNYSLKHTQNACQLLEKAFLTQNLIIDCSHGNSPDGHTDQATCFHSIIEQKLEHNPSICGVQLESYLLEGRQTQTHQYGLSVTDPCISWEQTKELLLDAAEKLSFQPVGAKAGAL